MGLGSLCCLWTVPICINKCKWSKGLNNHRVSYSHLHLFWVKVVDVLICENLRAGLVSCPVRRSCPVGRSLMNVEKAKSHVGLGAWDKIFWTLTARQYSFVNVTWRSSRPWTCPVRPGKLSRCKTGMARFLPVARVGVFASAYLWWNFLEYLICLASRICQGGVLQIPWQAS